MANPEQRRHPRIRRRLQVTIAGRGRSFAGFTGDLSASGVLIYCAEILQPGTAIAGSMELEGRTLSFGAMVRWSRSASRTNSNETQHSMGLAFLSGPGSVYQEYFTRAAIALGLIAPPEPPPPPPQSNDKKPKSAPPPQRPPDKPAGAAAPSAPRAVEKVVAAPSDRAASHREGACTGAEDGAAREKPRQAALTRRCRFPGWCSAWSGKRRGAPSPATPRCEGRRRSLPRRLRCCSRRRRFKL